MVFKNYCKDFLKKKSASRETVCMVGFPNSNSFYYGNNALVKKLFQSNFSNSIFTSYTEGYQSNDSNSNFNWPHHNQCNTWKYHARPNHKRKYIWLFSYSFHFSSCNKNKNYKKTKKTKRDFSNKNIQNFQFLLEINKMGPNFALKYT